MNNTIQPTSPDLSPQENALRLLDQMRIALHNHQHGKIAQEGLFCDALYELTGYKYSTCSHITRKVFGYE